MLFEVEARTDGKRHPIPAARPVGARKALQTAASWAYRRRDADQPTVYQMIGMWADDIRHYDPQQLEADGGHVFDSGLGETIIIRQAD